MQESDGGLGSGVTRADSWITQNLGLDRPIHLWNRCSSNRNRFPREFTSVVYSACVNLTSRTLPQARFYPHAKAIYLPAPSWGNHTPIAKDSGLEVKQYTYFDKETVGLNFEGMKRDIKVSRSARL